MTRCHRFLRHTRDLLAAAALVAAGPALAATVSAMSPQGEVAQVRQISLRFDVAVVPFGDLRQPDPATVSCSGQAPKGAGRWVNDKAWVFDLAVPLGPGSRCSLKLRPDWKPLAGSLVGTTEFSFSTGGPAVSSVQPGAGSEVEEEQAFVLQLTGPVVESDLAGKAWCELEGLGERLPLRLIGGAPRDAVLAQLRLKERAAQVLVADCGRAMPSGARLRLVWGRGIAARADPKVQTRVEQRLDFRVRRAFSAEFSCERERANAPCLPIRPLVLRFSEPIPRTLASQVRLQPPGGAAGSGVGPSVDKDDKSVELQELRFAGPFAERARLQIVLPPGLKDASGRPLANAGSFPLQVATGDAPPIAKFAAAPFGVIEHGPQAMLPITLRHVQGDLRPQAAGGQVRLRRIEGDAEVLAWYRKVQLHHESQLPAKALGYPEKDWYEWVEEVDDEGRRKRQRVERFVGTREVSLLAGDAQARRMALPQLEGGDPRPFEVVGIPLAEPGYHVVEVESRRLGESLLDRKAPMYVRTGVLVTNLGVHFKQGRENAVVWVTTLDRGRPVADAEVAINDCRGGRVWAGRTNADGVATMAQPLPREATRCQGASALMVSARKADSRGVVDMAFVLGDWDRGIESWRFNHPTSRAEAPDLRAHTVFDRTLLRAGETVSMKHFLRRESGQGLADVQPQELPTRVKLVHQGSGDEFTLPLAWRGTRNASQQWHIPPAAKLGVYLVRLERPAAAAREARSWTSGEFRVEEFRVPLLDARLAPPRSLPAAPRELAFSMQLNYMAGGPVAQAALRGSAVVRPRAVAFEGYEDFNFEPPRPASAGAGPDDAGDERLVADKVTLSTDREGAARFVVGGLPPIERPSEVLAEVSFIDPNGEVQTVASQVRLWPAGLVVGIRTGSWAAQRGKARFSVVALDHAGKPLAGQALEVRGRLAQAVATRKRIVGGFYAYDNRVEHKDLGLLCSGKSDAQGRLACEAALDAAGEVELVASARDAAGALAQAAAGVWVTRQGELWFEQDNDDRMDLLPDKRRVEPGDTVRLQVRMPFRAATALVAIEREGVMSTRLVTLRGDDPGFELKVEPGWAPNVYVSVLALRGRIRDVPWTSFFSWGWREPIEWARAFWVEGREYQAPTAMVDLSKPAFKLGVAELKVGLAAHALKVEVQPDKAQYPVRGKAQVRLRVTQGGQPAAGADVALAAVDEGLLALRDNSSWDLLGAMLQPRAWGVSTATAQSEIVGRRHYGRKAVAAGGSGGRGPTRELFDTLLLWQPHVALDARGEALVEVPLNDSLSSFRIVAVADGDGQRFGSGQATIRVTQDLQLLSGLPPLVRDGDRFQAMVTLRNTTPREMKLRATLQGTAHSGPEIVRTPLTLAPQDLVLPAGGAREIAWPVDVPAGTYSVAWEIAAEEQGGPARDRVRLTQMVAPAVPERVLQASLVQLDGAFSMPVAAPADALPAAGPKRGGVVVAVQPRLTAALPGLRRYFETYPFACLEQKTSRAVGLRDKALWGTVAGTLGSYLDGDGLASYFPPRADEAPRGSDRLTAYVLQATHEAGFELPEAERERMLQGLLAFVEGRIQRKFWAPRPDLDVRKLAALEALSRHGRAQARHLGSINLTPALWPTAALIDWLQVLRRVQGIPEQARRLDEAQQILRSRLSFAGTTLRFSTEEDDFWWWLMDSADANAARLILAVLDDPTWKEDLPRLVVGSLGRQKRGAWLTTTANLWGSLALDKFAARFEAQRPAGRTTATTTPGPAAAQPIDWARQPEGGRLLLPWPAQAGTLAVTHEGAGKPWLTVQSLAAIPLNAPLRAGYSVTRSVSMVEQKDKSRLSRGDVLRVRLEVEAQSDMSWVVVSDPVPGGATLLGSGLGRDSAIATRGEAQAGRALPAFVERGFEAWRSYFEVMPRGRHVMEYTLRLNNAGRFALPPTRVEAMYAPESFAESPNAVLEVAP
jgi:uncharacterized protein YfaS (alpha-2-macroglobulin family)